MSQNEEHVTLQLQIENHQVDLGERSHHYLLLVLARKWLSDRGKGLIEAEQGWIDKSVLSKMLGLSENHINIQIYRFRKQVISALPKSILLPQVIERRTGEVRLAYGHL